MQIKQHDHEVGMFGDSDGRAQFLNYLRGDSGWARKRREFMLDQAEYYGPIAVPAADPNLNYTLEVAPVETYERAEQVLTEVLRSLVSEWIDSGKNPDGQEEPLRRALSLGSCDAVNRYLQRHPPQFFLFEGNKIGAVFAEEKPQSTGPDDPIAAAKEEAIRLLVHFMDSDARRQLAKCFVCHEYFYPARKIRDFYQRGAYCEACRPKVSMLDTEDSREQWRKKVMKLAVEAWPKWRPSYGPQALWVAMRVNEKLSPGDKRIKGAWVTRNDEEIIARVQEMQNAAAHR